MQLRGLGEIKLLWISAGEISQFFRQSKSANGVLEEVGGAVEVGELNGFGLDEAVRVGNLGADTANGGLE